MQGDVIFDGEYLVGREGPSGDMLVEPTDAGRLAADDSIADDRREQAFSEMFEDWLGNGWDWIPPEAIGALTDAPILSQDFHYDDAGELVPHEPEDAIVYAHMDYMVESPVDAWAAGRAVRFRRYGSEPRSPRGAVEEALKTINRHRARIGQTKLHPKTTDWTDQDVLDEAERIRRFPNVAGHLMPSR